MVTDPPISVLSVCRRWRRPRARAWAGRCAALALVPVAIVVAVCVFAAPAEAQNTPKNPALEAKRKQPTEMLFKAV